jgi:hypothetical protein
MAAIHLIDYNLTYIHIPKTGGSSIESWLKNNFADRYLRADAHPTVKELHAIWPVTFSFASVRNPWARIVSFYFFYKQTKEDPNFDLSFDQTVDYLCKNNTQLSYIDTTTKIILRTESLNEDFKQIQDLTECYEPLPYINQTTHDDYCSYYNTQLKELVAQAFAQDIEQFKYTF